MRTMLIQVTVAATFAVMAGLPAHAQTAAPAPQAPAASQAAPGKKPSAGQLAARERQKTCSAEWKAAKAGGKLEPGSTWPKFWSACNKRLKAKSV